MKYSYFGNQVSNLKNIELRIDGQIELKRKIELKLNRWIFIKK
jgi:hypothetical protein